MQRTTWTIREDPFRLMDETGKEISLPYRKVQRVFIAIAKSGSEGISREILAEKFWPDSSAEERQVSLRQILSQLRRVFGEKKIISNRSSCAVNSGIAIDFEDEIQFEKQETPERPVTSFFKLLEWQSFAQPARMFEMMRLNYHLAEALTPLQKSQLIDQASNLLRPGDPGLIWSEFWRASMVLQSHGVLAAIPRFRQSVKNGVEINDPLLVGISVAKWALSEILLGRPESAIRIADRALNDSKVESPDKKFGLRIIYPTALIHMGREKEGMEQLYRLEADNDLDEIFHQNVNALLAVFEATNGQFDSALRRIKEPEKSSQILGDKGLEVVCRFTSGFVKSRTDPVKAIPQLIELRDYCRTSSFGHIALYADESLAYAYKAVREQGQAKRLILKSTKIRMAMGFRSTEWDRSRNQQLATL